MKTLKTILICSCFFLSGMSQLIAQEEDNTEKQPARAPFESSMLMDNQTVIVPTAKTLQMDLVHRFGVIENGISDFYGLYAPGANVRLGLNYTVIEDLSIGVGYSKLNKYVDFNLKYAILKQTKDWSMPVSMTYYGNVTINGNEPENFEDPLHRLSYFSQLIFATRVGPRLSVQVTPSYSHFNAVDSLMSNDVFGVGINGRYKFSPQMSAIFDYNQQLNTHDGVIDLQPIIAFGFEVSTSSHAFQVFVSTAQGILPQQNMVYNENKFDASGLLIGFNITRLWNF